jgi:hypothetical protein
MRSARRRLLATGSEAIQRAQRLTEQLTSF